MRKMKMLRKSILSLVLALSMVVSPLSAFGLDTVKAEGTETVYIDENFDSYDAAEIIRSTGNDVEAAPESVTLGQLVYAAGHRGNGSLTCVASIAGDDTGKYLNIAEDGYATSSRGISFTFNYTETVPTVAELAAAGTLLELSMDVTTTGVITLTGFGDIPVVTDGHVQAIIDAAANKQYVIITDADGKLVSSSSAALTATGFTGATFYVANTNAQIDNLKVVQKSVDLGAATVTVKDGDAALADVEVTIGSHKLTTDANGQVVLVLPNGTHTVTATKPGYEFTEGQEDAATGTIEMNSAAATLDLTLRVMAYKAQPTTVTIVDGQTYIEAPAEEDSVSTAAFATTAIDQMGADMAAADYEVEWSIVKATGEADSNVTISNDGVVTVAKAFAAKGPADEYIITAKASANGGEATGKFTILIGNNGVDYANDFTLAEDTSAFVAWSKSMDSTSGTGYFTLSVLQNENSNGYLHATVTGNGDRGSRLDISEEIVKGAEVSFDWMPSATVNSANGQLMFLSPDKWHPYFILRFDPSFNLYAYTKNPLTMCSTSQNDFEGSIDASNAINTGLGGQNTWFTVNLKFDYLNHTADLTITQKDDPAKTFTQAGIPIETEANGLKSFVIHMNKLNKGSSVTMGLDNLVIDFDKFGASDIVAIENPSDVKVAKEAYDDYKFPTEVTATLGDGKEVVIPVGEWTPSPEFSKDTEAVYTWTAPLVTGDYSNHFKLAATFDMDYTLYPFPTRVYNPTTLQLEFGEAWSGELPTSVNAYMSDKTLSTVEVGEWTAIRAFNADEEGIYVYGANVKATEGVNKIVREQLSTTEQHSDAEYVYDVYYRIGYFKTEDNYNAYARSMEYLDRGVYAVAEDDGVYVSWRLLVTEYGEDVAFNIYRNGDLVNDAPITTKTNYVDAAGKAGDVYVVEKVQDGLTYASDAVAASDKNYISIPLQRPEPQPTKDGTLATYTINDAGTADVDGDGQYEIIVKWYPSNAFDSGKAVAPSSPTIFDVYEMDGTALWRLNMGLEMPSGAHFNQFMLYDLDEDGKAELFMKTSDGTTSYKPNAEGKFDMTDASTLVSYIGDKSVVPGSNIGSNGHALSTTNEYVSVFNGQTGEEIDTIDYVNVTGNYADWGKDDGGNRSARYNIGIAYLPKEAGSTATIPAVLFNRGYYAKTTVAAYTLRDGKLNMEWNFVTESGTEWASKGNHNMSTGDVDNDGFDELVIGAMAIDHDGSVLWAKTGTNGYDYSGHADSIHLAAMVPGSNQLYVATPAEDTGSTLNVSVTNAGTGVRISGEFVSAADIGRGIAANITPTPGYEFWAHRPNSETPDQISVGSLYSYTGEVLAIEKPINFPANWRMYWDGDLLSELPDGNNPGSAEDTVAIHKYNWENNTLETLVAFSGTNMNNSTKNTPSLTADLLGDWREEIVVRSESDTSLRIYMTTEETDYMIYTLMHDPVYRNAVANQNTSYNQPPAVGFYLGEDNKDQVLAMQLPTAKVVYTTEEQAGVPDFTELKEAIAEAEALTEAEYTAESWAAVETALAAAKAELANTSATIESVAAAEKALDDAVAALEKAKTEAEKKEEATKEIQAEIAEAEGLSKSEYTAESWAAFENALAAANAILNSNTATSEDIAAAKTALANAMAALTKAGDSGNTGDSGNSGSDESDDSDDEAADNSGAATAPKTGDKTPVGAMIAILMVALGAAAVLFVKKKEVK